jgi:hypothetical protein
MPVWKGHHVQIQREPIQMFRVRTKYALYHVSSNNEAMCLDGFQCQRTQGQPGLEKIQLLLNSKANEQKEVKSRKWTYFLSLAAELRGKGA